MKKIYLNPEVEMIPIDFDDLVRTSVSIGGNGDAPEDNFGDIIH